ncbi:hypothetical protein [Acinetobacter beijerinckii]|uniref:hypothetical protein n=1 Tax=Acinetobacter beijerinckii TaxID=262668 RepID=UPI00240601DA|nr:hypothetical protein [Acinetobacter beijerinckii]
MKTVRAKTMDKATCFQDTNNMYQVFVTPKKRTLKLKVLANSSHRLVYYYSSKNVIRIWQEVASQIRSEIANQQKYFDIDNLARLAEEESFTMPRGLTREQRREWAKRNLIK